MSERALKAFAPLADLDASERQAVSEELEELELEAGTLLFDEGDASDAMFLLCEGSVRVESRSCWGGDELGSGAVLGALALLGDTPRCARVETASSCRFLRLERAGFQRIAATDPAVAGKLREAIWREAAALVSTALDAGASFEDGVGPSAYVAGVDPSAVAD